jgi:hypothetical protein
MAEGVSKREETTGTNRSAKEANQRDESTGDERKKYVTGQEVAGSQ